MWFNTGEPHPLASRLKLEVTVSHAAVHNLSEAMVIGDYILYWVGSSIFSETHEKPTLCNIYLVAWKEGWVSEVCICHHLDASQNQNNFVLLASRLPSRRVWLGIICTIRGDNPADSTGRTGVGAVPASEHRGQWKGLARNGPHPFSSSTYLESLLAMGGLYRRTP
jgi:hypothetical protein